MYKIMTNSLNEKIIIRDNNNGSYTSFQEDPANTDYQEYLEWVAEGNTPEEAD